MGEKEVNLLRLICISSDLSCVRCKRIVPAGEKCTILVGRSSEPGVHFVGFMCEECFSAFTDGGFGDGPAYNLQD